MRKQNLGRYTERAIRATEAGKLIPPIVYLPRMLRGKALTLTEDNMCLTVDPPTIEANHVRVAGADPVGFLIAVMHGQPIPEFRVTRHGAIELFYNVPELGNRQRAAEFLATKNMMRRRVQGQGALEDREADKDYKAMIARAQNNGELDAENALNGDDDASED